MRDCSGPGPATCVSTSVVGQGKEFITLPIGEDIEAFANRLSEVCRDHAGDAKRSYMFTARDDAGKKVGVLRHSVRPAVQAGPRTRLTALVEESVSQSTALARQFGGLGLDAVLKTCKEQERMLARLHADNQRLRKELDELRAQPRKK